MQDIVTKLQEILSSDSGKQKLNDVANMLGVGNNGSQNNSVDLSNLSNLLSQSNNQSNNNNNLDVSNLTDMLNNSNSNENQNNNFDMSNLSQLLGGLNNNSNNDNSNNNFDLSALSGLLGGGNNSNNNPLGNIDINMIMKLQGIMSTMNQENQNTNLLKALKPHFKEKRQSKIDNAIRIMQLISVWPALKDSGILGGLGGLFGGLGGLFGGGK